MSRHFWKIGVTLGALSGLIIVLLSGYLAVWVYSHPEDVKLLQDGLNYYLDDVAEKKNAQKASASIVQNIALLPQTKLKPEAQALFDRKLAECSATTPREQCLAILNNKRWWAYKTYKDLEDSSKDVIVGKVDATSTIGDQLGNAALVFRCAADYKDIIIAWGDNIGEEALDVSYRFGDEPVEVNLWTDSNSQDSLFFHGDKDNFIKKLGATDKLSATITKKDGAVITAFFDLGYTKEALSPIIGKCGWSF